MVIWIIIDHVYTYFHLEDVGRSCILVTIGGKNIMLDCGMHMGYNDEVFYFFYIKMFLIYM